MDLADVMCWWTAPITVLVVGYVASMAYSATTAQPCPSVTVFLDLARASDEEALQILLRRVSRDGGEYRACLLVLVAYAGM